MRYTSKVIKWTTSQYFSFLNHDLIIPQKHKKEQNNAICSKMDGPRNCYTE